MAPRGYQLEFRRRVVDLVEGGRKVAEIAAELGRRQSVHSSACCVELRWLPRSTRACRVVGNATRGSNSVSRRTTFRGTTGLQPQFTSKPSTAPDTHSKGHCSGTPDGQGIKGNRAGQLAMSHKRPGTPPSVRTSSRHNTRHTPRSSRAGYEKSRRNLLLPIGREARAGRVWRNSGKSLYSQT